MLDLLHDIWSRLQGEVRERVGEAAYASWLSGMRVVAMERSVCYLEARSRLVCDRVQRLYSPLLEELLSREIGTRVQVTVLPAADSMVPRGLEIGPSKPMVDAGNRTAVLMLQALADPQRRATLPSTLVLLHGPAGVGKTFLLRWWATLLPQRPFYITGEELTPTYQAAFRERRARRFTGELAQKEVLVIDEVHRLGGQEKVQLELLRVVQERLASGRITLCASRFHPHDIWRLDPVLESVWLSGFVAAIDLPDLEGRLRYLRTLEGPASSNGLAGAVERVARDVHGGYRDLRRAWLAQRANLSADVRGRYLQLVEPRATFERTLAAVCQAFDVAAADVIGKSQARNVSFARQVLSHLCVAEGLSRAEVARYLGNRSRAAVSYGIKNLHRRMAESDDVRRRVEGLMA